MQKTLEGVINEYGNKVASIHLDNFGNEVIDEMNVDTNILAAKKILSYENFVVSLKDTNLKRY